MMSWEDAEAMLRGGISFGSHTASHPALSRLSADQSRVEILKSKKAIEERLNIPVRSFAYPRGRREDFSERVKEQLKEAGYICALTTLFGSNDAGRDLFELKRGGPWEEYLPLFALKLSWQKFCY
jgi:peptidoglycan/xylan/chitin deacetylase (PgdA/CDA1 family)